MQGTENEYKLLYQRAVSDVVATHQRLKAALQRYDDLSLKYVEALQRISQLEAEGRRMNSEIAWLTTERDKAQR